MNAVRNRGISMIEVIIATSIISVSIIYISQLYSDSVLLSSSNAARVQAVFLLDEGVEAVKTMRGEAWDNIENTLASTTYYLIWENNKWNATTTPQIIDNTFTRTLLFSPVYRDNIGFNIGGPGMTTIDYGTKQVDISVSWLDHGATSTRNISMYIFDILGN
jgi:type II secretory pathway pseudopilin PulG